MAMRTRADVLPYHTGIDTQLLTRASKLVSAVTSFPVQYNKAIVGRNAFAHESGIHQDGMLKNADTYEIMTPESVGVAKTSLVMGKHSGRHAFKEKLKELGYELGENALKTPSSASRIWPTARRSSTTRISSPWSTTRSPHAHERIKVVALTVIAGTEGPQIGGADARYRRRAVTRIRRPATARSTRSSTPSTPSCRTRRRWSCSRSTR